MDKHLFSSLIQERPIFLSKSIARELRFTFREQYSSSVCFLDGPLRSKIGGRVSTTISLKGADLSTKVFRLHPFTT